MGKCSLTSASTDLDYCSTIGLGRPRLTPQTWYNDSDHDTALAIPNLMHHLTTEIPMKNKVMVMELPKDPDHPGKLTIGETTPEVDFCLPLVDVESAEHVNHWIVRLDQVALQSNPPLTFPNLRLPVAVTLEAYKVIALPKAIAETILKAVGVDSTEQSDIDCAIRESLPDLMIEFEGHEIVLKWQDYTLERENDEDGRKECYIMITSVREQSVGNVELAYIGHGLLRKYDVVFDMDNNEVGCKSLQDAGEEVPVLTLSQFGRSSRSSNTMLVMRRSWQSKSAFTSLLQTMLTHKAFFSARCPTMCNMN